MEKEKVGYSPNFKVEYNNEGAIYIREGVIKSGRKNRDNIWNSFFNS